MALIRFPEGQQRSGSSGGIVYSRNRYGQYIRPRTVPVNPNTDRQVAARNLARNLAIAWRDTLTQALRDAWDLLASVIPWENALGDVVHLTGLNWYNRCNVARMQGGLARIDDPSGIPGIEPAESALVVTASEATQQLSVAFDDTAAWCSDDAAGQLVSMATPLPASRKFCGGPWRYAGVILGNSVTPPTSPATIAVAWPIVEGNRLWVRTRIAYSNGGLSNFAQVNFLGAA